MLSPRRHAVLIATAIALAGFFAAVSSSIAATTIGSDLVAAPNGAVACGASPDCTYAQSALPGAQLTATSPGVIVRWRLKTSAAGGGPLKLRVLRSAGLNTFLGVSTSGSENATAAGINTFATRISIVAGDQIGIDQTAAGSSIQYARTGAGGASSYFRNPAVPDGSALVASVVNAGIEFLINADIEADGDVDGFGDETQDACPALAGQEAGCPPATVVQVTASKRQSLRKLKLSVVKQQCRHAHCACSCIDEVEAAEEVPRHAVDVVVDANRAVDPEAEILPEDPEDSQPADFHAQEGHLEDHGDRD